MVKIKIGYCIVCGRKCKDTMCKVCYNYEMKLAEKNNEIELLRATTTQSICDFNNTDENLLALAFTKYIFGDKNGDTKFNQLIKEIIEETKNTFNKE